MLLLLLVFSFGLMLPQLGYGFDEWHFIYYSTRGAQGLAELFHYDGHPQATWSYIQSFNILGYTPLYWHLYALLLRWLAVVSFWLCLKAIWPANHRQNFLAAALFAVHPVFTLQFFPITFFEIWFGYILLFLSFLCTILAIRSPEKQRVFMLVAIALAVGHVFTKEYAWFVELMRPALIWLALPAEETWRTRMKHTAKIWFPFLVIFLSFLVWRGFFYTPLRKFFQVQGSIFTNPLRTVLVWAADLPPDIGIVLFTSWYKTFNSEYVYIARPFNVAVLVLVILVVVSCRMYIRRIDLPSQSDERWAGQAVLLGLPSLLFGIMPFYIASYSIHLTDPPLNSRLAIGMLPGAALITAALLESIITRQSLRIWMMALVLGLSVGWHVRYTNDVRKVWEYQSNFLQQLTWRIPGMEKNTALFVWQPALPEIDNADLKLLYGEFGLSMAVNSIYDPNPAPADDRLPYWYYALSGDQAAVSPDAALHSEHATTYFDGNSSNSLMFSYDPGSGQCLHLINTEDQHYKQYPDAIKELSAQASTDRVSSTRRQNVKLRNEIFGTNEHAWCFYYEQADLARQYKQWGAIPKLWQQATNDHVETEFGPELIPFIDGFAHVGEWQKARELTLTARKLSKGMNSILCPLWDDIERSTTASTGRDDTINQVRLSLECIGP